MRSSFSKTGLLDTTGVELLKYLISEWSRLSLFGLVYIGSSFSVFTRFACASPQPSLSATLPPISEHDYIPPRYRASDTHIHSTTGNLVTHLVRATRSFT